MFSSVEPSQTVKLLNAQRTLVLNLKNCEEEILWQTICAQILSQNTAFVPEARDCHL